MYARTCMCVENTTEMHSFKSSNQVHFKDAEFYSHYNLKTKSLIYKAKNLLFSANMDISVPILSFHFGTLYQ
jgi:hypothetical protein